MCESFLPFVFELVTPHFIRAAQKLRDESCHVSMSVAMNK